MPGRIQQEVDLIASPDRVYAALTDAKQFTTWSGAPAEIDGKTGGAFSVFGGMVVGRQLELSPGRRVVQAWRAGDWKEGDYSVAHFELTPHGTGTRLIFDHAGFPEERREHLAEGWGRNYWEPLRKFLA